ncbi:glycosyltransferase family 2 protein [Caldilinea sp.]|uniref:glycosyltransferase family 2 protein n=1 Tax=Caldilinea sp. TaxID=2293560 RepID=UPI002CD4B508|nr:glycosyltransferase family 2 protein [Anaerolineales bacterium]HQY93987.1 glycosyltransferase family 2 protein [Caldilinea sp.]
MLLSVVIVNWNTRDLLMRCLRSLQTARQALPAGATEVIVVDNGSSDGSPQAVAATFDDVQLIANQHNAGFAAANNQALRYARGEFLLLLNSDAEIVYPNALLVLLDALMRRPDAGAAGPLMLNTDGSMQSSFGELPTVLDEWIGPYWADFYAKPWGRFGGRFWRERLEQGKPFAVDRVSFACTLIRRTALERVGRLDEAFTFYSEDYDWFRRLKDAHMAALFCPHAVVMHHWGASSRQRSEWSLRQLYRSKRRYFAKHAGVRAERMLRVGLFFRFAARMALTIARCLFNRPYASQSVTRYWLLMRDLGSAP